jgi:hypothetical protein
MKREHLLLSAVVLFVIIAAAPLLMGTAEEEDAILGAAIRQYISCEDSDSGKDYFTAGKVDTVYYNFFKRRKAKTFQDSCRSSTQLREFFCDGERARVRYYECEGGCSEGACTPICTDSDDGKNIHVKGKINLEELGGSDGSNGWDYCFNGEGTPISDTGKYLNEWFCCGGSCADNEIYNCLDGCENGACIEEELKCTDCDINASQYEGDIITYTIDGVNYEVDIYYIGSTTTRFKINGEITKVLAEGETDTVAGVRVCIEEVIENEATLPDGAGRDEVEFCLKALAPGGEPICFDTDADAEHPDGLNYYVEGYAQTNWSSNYMTKQVDICKSEKDLIEGFCDGNEPKGRPYICPGCCANDACIKPVEVLQDICDNLKMNIRLKAGIVTVPTHYLFSPGVGPFYLGKNADKSLFTNENKDVFGDGDEYFVVSNSTLKESYLMQIVGLDKSDYQIWFRDVRTGDKYMVTYNDDNNNDKLPDGAFTIGNIARVDIDMNDIGANDNEAILYIDMDDNGIIGDNADVPLYHECGGAINFHAVADGHSADEVLITDLLGGTKNIKVIIDEDGCADVEEGVW